MKKSFGEGDGKKNRKDDLIQFSFSPARLVPKFLHCRFLFRLSFRVLDSLTFLASCAMTRNGWSMFNTFQCIQCIRIRYTTCHHHAIYFLDLSWSIISQTSVILFCFVLRSRNPGRRSCLSSLSMAGAGWRRNGTGLSCDLVV